LRLDEFLYDLPEELIAQRPLPDRAASRLLVLDRKSGAVQHRAFRDVPDLLAPGDFLVLNDTRVSALRVLGERATGGKVEALLLTDEGGGRFVALTRPAKKLKDGERIGFEGGLSAVVEADLGEGRKRIAFDQTDFQSRLKDVGQVPLPPYVHGRLDDPERYQTVYAEHAGSAAAPTAGLHFTKEVLQRLEDKGVGTARVTLDVSLDTFRPISAQEIEGHTMHGERCVLPKATADKVNACQGRVIAVGTTCVRTLESFATGNGEVGHGEMVSKLFISPGYSFRAVDAMFTNFHMPGTTMLVLLSAFAGRENVLDAYRAAVEERYRFLSFGDSMLVV
jgi:S-adenosylmethionine:tRNA ribosyltransferase-isomerase